MSADLFPQLREVDSDQELADLVESFYRADQASRGGLSLLWEENLRMLAGEQWLNYTGAGDYGSWETMTPRQASASPSTQPRTNHLFPQVRALASMMVKNLPRGTARGKEDDPSKVLARTVEALIEVLEEENLEKTKKLHWVLWAITCGLGWKKNYMTREVPVRGGEPLTPAGAQSPLLDENDEPQRSEVPKFEEVLRSTILSPFEIAVDLTATTPWDIGWIMEYSLHSVEWFRTAYGGPKRQGYTGLAEKVEAERNLDSPLNIWNRLKNIGPLWFGSFSADTDLKNAAVLKVLYVKPCKSYPGGLEVHVANGIPLLVRGRKRGDRVPLLEAGVWHPYVPFGWFPQLGRFWPVSMVENITSPQRKINSIDAVRTLNRGTMLAPKILMPTGAQVDIDYLTGIPGQIIEYNADASDHAPIVIPSTPLAPDVTQERSETLEEIKEIAGTQNPISGERAKGIPSYAGQALQMERASDQHMLTHIEWETAIEKDTVMQVAMVSKLGIAKNNPRYIDLVRTKLKLSGVEVGQLVLEDLSDSVIYRVEGGSSVPRSKVLFQQALTELVGAGAVDISDPEIHYEYLTLFGAERFHKDSHHLKKAQLENVILQRGQHPPDLLSPFDDDPIHIASHTKHLVENWFTMTSQARQAHQDHLIRHEKIAMLKMQRDQIIQQTGEVPPMPQPAQAQANGATPPSPQSQGGSLTPGGSAPVQSGEPTPPASARA